MSWANGSSAWTATTSTTVKAPTTPQDVPDEVVKRADAFLQDLSDELGLAFGRPYSQHLSPSPKNQPPKPSHANPLRNTTHLEKQRLNSAIETLLQSQKARPTTAADPSSTRNKPMRLRPEVTRHLFGVPRHRHRHSHPSASAGQQRTTPPSQVEPRHFKHHRGKTREIRPTDDEGRERVRVQERESESPLSTCSIPPGDHTPVRTNTTTEHPSTHDKTPADAPTRQAPGQRKRKRANTPTDPTPPPKRRCLSTRAHRFRHLHLEY